MRSMKTGLAFGERKRNRAQMRVLQTDRQTEVEKVGPGVWCRLCVLKS